MKLKDYFTKNEEIKEFINFIGISQPCFSFWCNGKRIPSKTIMKKIMRYTAGAVTPNDFYDLDEIEGLKGGENGSEKRC